MTISSKLPTRSVLRRAAWGFGAVVLVVLAALPAGGGQRASDEALVRLRSAEPAERVAACRALIDLAAQDAERVLPVLADALRDPVAGVRLAAGEAILAASLSEGKGANAVVRLAPRVIERLADSEPEVRALAARVLAAGSPHTPAVAADALTARLSDPAAEVRQAAAVALGGLQTPGEAVLAALVAALRDDPVGAVRAESARAIGRLRADDREVIDALVAAVAESDPFVARQAVRALGKIGPAAYSAAGALEAVAVDPHADAETRMHAVYALRSLGVPAPRD